jgi:RNA polymerase sigma-70 factor (ECF subfamily)
VVSNAAEAEQLEEEQKLVEEAQAGNLDAMRPIFERYAQPLYAAVIMPRMGDRATAEDVLRDTFITAIEKINKFTWTGKSIYVWLRQIAINKTYDVHRKSKRTLKLVESAAREESIKPAPPPQADVALIAVEEQKINRARIDTTLDQISERYRLAIQLRLVEELPREECAERMDVTVGTFDVVLFRAVRAFRKKFGDRQS